MVRKSLAITSFDTNTILDGAVNVKWFLDNAIDESWKHNCIIDYIIAPVNAAGGVICARGEVSE